jgi:hypothetical protein
MGFSRLFGYFANTRLWQAFYANTAAFFKKMDSLVQDKLEEWNLTCLKNVFEGKDIVFYIFFAFATTSKQLLCFE